MVQRKSIIRVAFWFDAPIAYTGGLNYIYNLLYALNTVSNGAIRPYIFFATDVPADVISRFQQHATIVKTSLLKRKTISWLIHKLTYKIFRSMFWVNKLLKHHQIEVLSHAWTPYLGSRPIKVISWIPDFQYLHLPEMFPRMNFERESQINREIAINADAVVISSEHAKTDLISLMPIEMLPSVEVLRFVSQPFSAPDQLLPSLEYLKDKYKFSGNFFILPNQFWAHKNHEVVLQAIYLAKLSGLNITVLMTGNTQDYRLTGSPYIDRLRNTIKSMGIDEQARILGLIDYNDLISLMRHCVGFINPSRFEGWSSSVEEAKSLGKPVLMSRIPVHVEQAPPNGEYFDCDDAELLAELMRKLWYSYKSDDSIEIESAAKEDLKQRTETFGWQYLNIIKQVLGDPVL